MISTLLITIITESLIVLGYCIWLKKPAKSILLTSIGANFITQPLLWGSLNLFFQHYLLTLLIAEILVWLIETLFLYHVPTNRLQLGEAMILSLIINLASLAAGWLLPI